MSGEVRHAVSADGLTMVSTYTAPDGGTAKVTVGWDSLDKARANYANAEAAFETRLTDFRRTLVEAPPFSRTRNRLRHVGPLAVLTQVGPPTWWLPKVQWEVRSGRRIFGLGWLRAAASISRWNARETS